MSIAAQAANQDFAEAEFSAPEAGKLYLRVGTLQTRQIENVLAQPLTAFGVSKAYVIQLEGPMTPERRDALTRAGVKLQTYLPLHAYIVELSAATPEGVGALPFVSWVGAYQDAWKIDPGIGRRLEPFQTEERIALAKEGKLQLAVILFADRDLDQGKRDLAALGAVVLDGDMVGDQAVITVVIDANQLGLLALQPNVQYVEESPEITLRNSTTRWIVQSNVSAVTPLYDNGITGVGQIVGIMDGRINVNHCSFFDSDPIGPLHRKIEAYNASLGSDTHGTHVGGTAVGDAGLTNDTRGIAFGGRLCYNTIPSFTESAMVARLTLHHNQGARMHTNSWGNDGTTAYDSLCRGIDLFSYNNEDDLIFFAVTNLSTLKNPENAKNLVAVGASQDTPSQHVHCSGGAGPTLDGRRKPEVYAPGCNTLSSNGSGCATIPLTGTSMASPAVTGVAMLIRQYYMDGYYPSGAANPSDSFVPSSALVKATLINASVDMTGVAGYPSNTEGWGRVLADRALYFPGDVRKIIVLDDIRNAGGLSTGNSMTYPVTVSGSGEQLRFTLVWTEPAAAAGAAIAYINNLDLTVTSPSSQVYLGNVFTGGVSVPGGVSDIKNNVEQVHLNAPETGTWMVAVNGTVVNQGLQGYALIVTGAVSLDPTCDDGVQNQGEDLIDCGGPCPPCQCLTDEECVDKLFCNGLETCLANGQCSGVSNPCTDPDFPFCDEKADTCLQCLNDGDCEDGLFCTGVESCDADGNCQASGDPCAGTGFPFCDEAADECDQCLTDADCDDQDECSIEDCNVGPNVCEYTFLTILYADVVRNGIVDLNDLLCVLAGFEDPSFCPNGDIAPCDGGDGNIDVADVLAAVAAFEGNGPCPDPCPPPG